MPITEIQTSEKNDAMVPPHLNAEVYKTDTTGNLNVLYLDYIRIHSDGTALVGSSELTGRYWDGGATIIKNLEQGKSLTTQEDRTFNLLSGNADGCFVESSKKVLLCEDNGAVGIWSINEDQTAWGNWREERTVVEHDAAVLAVDCLSTGKEYVTVGADGNAKVWDLNDMICIRHYEAHTNTISGVSVRPTSNSYFATCSYDDHITLWDHSINKPAQDLFKNDCGVRCVQWIDDNNLVFGDEAGILRMLDIRNTISPFILTEFPAAVHKLAVNQDGKVAVCCDNRIVTVCDVSEDRKCTEVYHDRHMHSNFVRGLHWDPQHNNVLHTVGWDSVIKTHNIS